ncbi:hypothetical protein VTO73DRAFT_13538 [Trametes versicolor]
MDQLAVELLTEIFTMACTDGGQATARSLSLVCKQYNAVALPLRFHSIRLGADATRIMPLLAALEQEHAIHDPAHAPKVRHIRLVDMARLWQKGVRGRNSLYHAEIAKPWFALLSSILRLAAPHLETLAVCGYYLAQLMPAVEFPALRELYCVAGPKHFSSVAKGIEPGVRLYPALERLHHVGDFNSDVEGWAHHAPNVTHLYVSQISTKAGAYILAKVNGAPSWATRNSKGPRGSRNLEQFNGTHHSPTDRESFTKLPFPKLKLLVMKAAGHKAISHGINPTTWPSSWSTRGHRAIFSHLWKAHDRAIIPTYIIPSVGPWVDEVNCTGELDSQWTVDERLLRTKYSGEAVPDSFQDALADPPGFCSWDALPTYPLFSLPNEPLPSTHQGHGMWRVSREFLESRRI